MTMAMNISRPIVEALYNEALTLADEVRLAFDLSLLSEVDDRDDDTRLALSTEGLRTTTRVMHVLAWLLNHKAYFSGDMTELQLRRYSTLPEDRIPVHHLLTKLELPTQELVRETVLLHARIARLDKAWRENFALQPTTVSRMHDRLCKSFGS